jgi:hypothetical protein
MRNDAMTLVDSRQGVAPPDKRSLQRLYVVAPRVVEAMQTHGDKNVLAPRSSRTTSKIRTFSISARMAVAACWHMEPSRGQTNRRFTREKPPFGATIGYSLSQKASKASLKMLDIDGQLVRELSAETKPSLHKIVWDSTHIPARRGRGRQFQQTSRPVAPGNYLIVLTGDGNEYKQALRVEEEK